MLPFNQLLAGRLAGGSHRALPICQIAIQPGDPKHTKSRAADPMHTFTTIHHGPAQGLAQILASSIDDVKA